MASYLRPRRGKEATAKSQNIVLKRGEIFFETPAGGVGTGIGRLKMGDGSTSYASLPYFLKQLDLNDNNTKCAFTNVTADTNKSNNNTYLNNIAPGNSLKTLFQNIKQLLLNYNSQLTSLNNDLAGKQPKGSYAAANHNHNGVYQPAGSYASSSHTHNMSGLNYDYSTGNIPGYNGKYMKIVYKNNVKEEWNFCHFTNVPYTQGYGNLFYNQLYSVPLFNTYTTIYGVEINVACNNGLMGATFVTTKKIEAPAANAGRTAINYWLYSSKSGKFDITVYYHVIGI